MKNQLQYDSSSSLQKENEVLKSKITNLTSAVEEKKSNMVLNAEYLELQKFASEMEEDTESNRTELNKYKMLFNKHQLNIEQEYMECSE